jgi:hypothetical protein
MPKGIGIDFYDETEVQLQRHMFILCRANSDKEAWFLLARNTGGLIYIRQQRTGWRMVEGGKKLVKPNKWQYEKTGKNTLRKESYYFEGTLEETLANLRAAGIEEQHLETHKERGFITWGFEKQIAVKLVSGR